MRTTDIIPDHQGPDALDPVGSAPAGAAALDAIELPVRSRLSVAAARVGFAVRRTAGRRHRIVVEAVLLVATYLLYDAARGLVGGGNAKALADAQSVAHLERHLGLFIEPSLQRALEHVPGVMGLFGFGYATFHLGVTIAVLLWAYLRRPASYARLRTALLAATGFALIGFVAFPAAPPRLAGIGVADTLELGRSTAGSGLLRFLYNPYAAMPSLHFAFAVLVGGAVLCLARRRWVRVLGLVYPVFIAVEVLATGNHFVLDLVGGAAAAVLAVGVAVRLAPAGPDRRLRPAFAAIGGQVRGVASAQPDAHGGAARVE